MLAVEVLVACRSQEAWEEVLLFPVRIIHSQGAFWILSEFCWFIVLSRFALLRFVILCNYFSFLLEEASKPSRDPGCQYQRPLPSLDYPFSFFSLEFRYTRGLYKVSSRVHAFCLCSARVCTHAILVTVACLDRLLFVQGGAVIPLFDKKYSSQV